jgi:hypothetical protein
MFISYIIRSIIIIITDIICYLFWIFRWLCKLVSQLPNQQTASHVMFLEFFRILLDYSPVFSRSCSETSAFQLVYLY